MDFRVSGKRFCPSAGAQHGVVQPVVEFEPAFTHGGGTGLAPFQFVDVQEVEEREGGGKVFESRERRHLDADEEPHLPGEGGGAGEVGIEDTRPGFMWWVEPDLVDKALQAPEHGLVRCKAGVEVDLVVGAEMLLESSRVLHHPVEFDERFAAGDAGSKSAHALCDLDGFMRRRYLPFVCKDHVPPLPLARERAVPAGAPAPAGHEEDHLRPLMAEDAARGEVLLTGWGYSRILWHDCIRYGWRE